MNRGKFIVFEGVDGSGKTTISRMLQDKMEQMNLAIHHTCEPTRNPVGGLIRKIITKQVSTNEQTIGALFLADRLDHIQHPDYGMLQYLEKGEHVISDRYYYSSYAYHVPHLTMDWVINANKLCADFLRPDLVLFLDIPVEETLRRISDNRDSNDLFETEERLTQVRNNYQEAIKREGTKDNVQVVDATGTIEEVFASVWKKVSDLLSK